MDGQDGSLLESRENRVKVRETTKEDAIPLQFLTWFNRFALNAMRAESLLKSLWLRYFRFPNDIPNQKQIELENSKNNL